MKPFYDNGHQRIFLGNAPDVLRHLEPESFHMALTSPPYYALRQYSTGHWEGGDPVCTHKNEHQKQGATGVISGEHHAQLHYRDQCRRCGAIYVDEVWDGDANCEHDWQTNRYYVDGSPASKRSTEAFSQADNGTSNHNAQRVKDGRWRTDNTCSKCGAVRCQLGLERHPRDFVRHLASVFDELQRVLRKDSTFWLNLGDSYAGGNTGNQSNVGQRYKKGDTTPPILRKDQLDGITEKNLLMVPARVAIELQDNHGWILRNDIIWAKAGSAMPESVQDRCSKSHEHLFLFSRQPRYYYDATAIAEPVSGNAHPRRNDRRPTHGQARTLGPSAVSLAAYADTETKNRRDVWNIPPESFSGAHYAVMPQRLALLCILAGTSEYGVCSTCRSPYERILERTTDINTTRPQSRRALDLARPHGLTEAHLEAIRAAGATDVGKSRVTQNGAGHNTDEVMRLAAEAKQALGGYYREFTSTISRTTGWQPICSCTDSTPVPAAVLDCFAGSGTTLLTAKALGRDAVGIELSEEYATIAAERLDRSQDNIEPWLKEQSVTQTPVDDDNWWEEG